MIGAIDDRDGALGVAELARGVEATESGADNQDTRVRRGLRFGVRGSSGVGGVHGSRRAYTVSAKEGSVNPRTSNLESRTSNSLHSPLREPGPNRYREHQPDE